jgi:hypothetical protein
MAEDKGPSVNGRFYKGDMIALLYPEGGKIPRHVRRIDELMPQLTEDEIREVFRRETVRRLAEATAEERREMLSEMDECPCCKRWLGHNQPPADDDAPPSSQRQTTFDFNR